MHITLVFVQFTQISFMTSIQGPKKIFLANESWCNSWLFKF